MQNHLGGYERSRHTPLPIRYISLIALGDHGPLVQSGTLGSMLKDRSSFSVAIGSNNSMQS